MSLGRHNNGAFSRRHVGGAPVITCYDDAYSYLVKKPNEFDLYDAVAIHMFDIWLRSDISSKEALNNNIPLSSQEIDDFIMQSHGKADLDGILKDAHDQIKKTFKPSWKRITWETTYIGAWQGVCGNVLSFLILIIAGLIVSGHIFSVSQEKFDKYYQNCVGILLPWGSNSTDLKGMSPLLPSSPPNTGGPPKSPPPPFRR